MLPCEVPWVHATAFEPTSMGLGLHLEHGDAPIYSAFQFLEAFFVLEAVWALTCNTWNLATLSLFTVKSMEKLTS